MAEDTINPGLEDVVVAETRLSAIDGEAGELTIAGFPLEELAPRSTYEETAFLLWNDRLPSSVDLDTLRDDLAQRRTLPETTLHTLRAAASREVTSMDALRMAVSNVSLMSGQGDPTEQARDLVAQLPTMVAAFCRYHGGKDPIDPDPDLAHTENFLAMLQGEEPDEAAVRGLETYLTTVSDHGLNASTFTARAITSTESDMISAVTGAVGALKGPLHGGAPGPVLEMIKSIEKSGDPEGYLTERLDAGERIMGFGHRVYEVRDPRADVLAHAAERFYEQAGNQAFFDLAEDIEHAAVDILEDRYPDADLDTNVEFYTALLLHGLGIPKDAFSAVFAMGRVGGWTAHCLEQREDNRLIRPRSKYVGAYDRAWQPVEDREGS